jgi:hypothetical protein
LTDLPKTISLTLVEAVINTAPLAALARLFRGRTIAYNVNLATNQNMAQKHCRRQDRLSFG